MKYLGCVLLMCCAMANAEGAPVCDLTTEVEVTGPASADAAVGVFKADGTVDTQAEIKDFKADRAKVCAWENRFGLLWVRYDEKLVLLDPGELRLKFNSKPCIAQALAPSAPTGKATVAAAGVSCKSGADPKGKKP